MAHHHHQYTGPVDVQAFPEVLGSRNVQVHAPLPLPTGKQAELLERLKQLRAWQQQQQADLIRQQQEQLLKLRNEQMTVGPVSPNEVYDRQERAAEEIEESSQDIEEGEGGYGGPSVSDSLTSEIGLAPKSTSSKNSEMYRVEAEYLDQQRTGSHGDTIQKAGSGSDGEECLAETDFHRVSIEHVHVASVLLWQVTCHHSTVVIC